MKVVNVLITCLCAIVAGLFWLFVLLPTYPLVLLMAVIGGWDVGEFTKAWFSFGIIP